MLHHLRACFIVSWACFCEVVALLLFAATVRWVCLPLSSRCHDCYFTVYKVKRSQTSLNTLVSVESALVAEHAGEIETKVKAVDIRAKMESVVVVGWSLIVLE